MCTCSRNLLRCLSLSLNNEIKQRRSEWRGRSNFLRFTRNLSNVFISPRSRVPKSLQTGKRYVGIWSSSEPSDWNKAVSNAEKIVGYPTSFMSLRCLLSDEISNVVLHMRKLVGTQHPLLRTARGLVYDGKHGLQTRGLIVLLLSKAAGPGPQIEGKMLEKDKITGICPRQRSLAEVTEMIHTANLIHKGVVNLSDLDPVFDGPIKDMEFGNKMAVLSGDFLLANASTGLAELKNTKVVETMSSAIGDLMEAEFTGLRDGKGNPALPSSVTFSDWLKQTFLSSGSLLAKSCQSSMELVKHDDHVQKQAFEFGCNMAYVQQLNEDMAPFLHPEEFLDQLTMVSAPVMKYAEIHGVASLDTFTSPLSSSDRKQIVSLIQSSQVLNECLTLCEEYGQKAIQALDIFPHSDAKMALVNIVEAVMK
ncbi:all trans-polyprenyl-diphosphate synthase PDSS2-like isoform X2 [Haliotis asinina]|uniref:all trans-polyprenyl-diphosphate synthase PDSS2-like isoform X2 n=1 Tax=Haliotis asinina TaxID=109174 RepID=UPI0035321858